MADKTSEACMTVRFLINTKTQRIVYAEAGKEFVDFLFSFLPMPIGSVLKLLSESQSESESAARVGSVSNLYDSIEKLPSQFMGTDKSQLLDPKFITTYSNNSLRIEGGNYYACSYISNNTTVTHNVSSNSADRCICGYPINRLVQLRQNTNIVNQASGSSSSQNAGQENGGYVKEMITFIITDDLKITGSSTITSIMLLNQLNIKDLTDLQERTAIVDHNKALEILGASLVSTTVLNDVFGAEFSVSQKVSIAE